MKIPAVFGPWNGKLEIRESVVRGFEGEPITDPVEMEVPVGWSQEATDILAQKYARKTGVPGTRREVSVLQIIGRMVNAWADHGEAKRYFDTRQDVQIFKEEITHMLLEQMAAPNSPQWFNTGLFPAYGVRSQVQYQTEYDPERGVYDTITTDIAPQPSACFIQSVRDDLVGKGGIMDLWKKEAHLFKYGSGTGSNFSDLRAHGEKLSGGGRSSGLMSFLKIGDVAAGAIKSGGTTRRAAKMVCLDLDHPDIVEFVTWKVREQAKVAALVAGSRLIDKYQRKFQAAGSFEERSNAVHEAVEAGVPAAYALGWKLSYGSEVAASAQTKPMLYSEVFDTGWQSEAYNTVSGQNSNNSVRIPRSFFDMLEDPERLWPLFDRTTRSMSRAVPASQLLDIISYSAWKCADPGVQFDTTINDWHTCKEDGRIRASNPCSEYMFLDDTACNLASLNLVKFQNKDGSLDLARFQHAVSLWTIVLDISVGMASYPTPEISIGSANYRTLGLGYANLGAYLMRAGLSYDSAEGRVAAAALTDLLTSTSYRTSSVIALELGAFPRYKENRGSVQDVLRKHYQAHTKAELRVGVLPIESLRSPVIAGVLDQLEASKEHWDVLCNTERPPIRNAQVTCIAPTGTIGLLMDCDTTGIEPDFALVKHKNLAGGGFMTLVNQSIEPALQTLGYSADEISKILVYVETEMTIEGAPELAEHHLPVFDCANKCGPNSTRSLSWQSHIEMMAAVQPFVSGAISKTVNMPNSATPEDVRGAYIMAHDLGCKSVAIYRDGSKLSQPLMAGLVGLDESIYTKSPIEQARALAEAVARRRLPSKRPGYTQKVNIGGHKLYLRTGEYPDGTLGEIFIDMSKEGESLHSWMNNFAIAVSIGLQYGVPLDEYVDAYTFTQFAPHGMVTGDENIKMSSSVLDYVFRNLGVNYLDRRDLAHIFEEAEQELTLDQAVNPDLGDPWDTYESGQAAAEASSRGYVGEPCPGCSAYRLVRNGTCLRCTSCGETTGCS